MNLGSDSLGKSNDLGVSSVSRICFGFEFIVNHDPDPIIKYHHHHHHRYFLKWPKQQRHHEDHYIQSKYEQYQSVL